MIDTTILESLAKIVGGEHLLSDPYVRRSSGSRAHVL
jgi:hypothetical protein